MKGLLRNRNISKARDFKMEGSDPSAHYALNLGAQTGIPASNTPWIRRCTR